MLIFEDPALTAKKYFGSSPEKGFGKHGIKKLY